MPKELVPTNGSSLYKHSYLLLKLEYHLQGQIAAPFTILQVSFKCLQTILIAEQ